MMWHRKKEEIQRLNLEYPKPVPAPTPAPAQGAPGPPDIDPAKIEAIKHRAEQLLKAGRTPDWLFACGVGPGGLLALQPTPDHKRIMLLFSHPFGAADYLRATGSSGKLVQFKIESLPDLSRSWLAQGAQAAALDRCPRCPQFLTVKTDALVTMSTSDFVKIWVHHRATRMVMAETRILSAAAHLRAGNHAAARADYEYIRDHFDCGVPYLHQIIGMMAAVQNDEPAKLNAMERLKEFGPQFEGPLDFSIEFVAAATHGLMLNFLMPTAGA